MKSPKSSRSKYGMTALYRMAESSHAEKRASSSESVRQFSPWPSQIGPWYSAAISKEVAALTMISGFMLEH